MNLTVTTWEERPVRAYVSDGLGLPSDLRAWLGASELAAAAHRVVGQFENLLAGNPSQPAWNDLPRSGQLLRLLVLCYSTGRFASSEIAHEISTHGPLANDLPIALEDWLELLRFRRRQRAPLRTCLGALLQQVWECHHQGVATASSYQHFPVEGEVESQFPAPSSSWFLKEAEARLHLAARRDSMVLDE